MVSGTKKKPVLSSKRYKGYIRRVKERSRERTTRSKKTVCNLSKTDRKFFKMFLPKVFENDILTKYNECEKISSYVLNQVLSGSKNEMERESGLVIQRKSDYIINKFMGRGSFGYVMNVVDERDDTNYVLKLIAVKKGKEMKEYNYNPFTDEEKAEENNINTKFKAVNGEQLHIIEREIAMQHRISKDFENDDFIKIPKVYRMRDMSKSNNLYGILMEKIGYEPKSGYSDFMPFPKPASISEEGWKQYTAVTLSIIIKGIHKLHIKGYTHGDIAHRNMMYQKVERKITKLVFFDFGRTLNMKDDVKDPFNRVMLKLFDYYSLLIEIFRSFESVKITNDTLSEFHYVSDCLSEIVKPYLNEIFEEGEKEKYKRETDMVRLIYYLTLSFADMPDDEKKIELMKNKRWAKNHILHGHVFRKEEVDDIESKGEMKTMMRFFSFFE